MGTARASRSGPHAMTSNEMPFVRSGLSADAERRSVAWFGRAIRAATTRGSQSIDYGSDG